MNSINVYCDESNHLENSPTKTMVLGATYCPKFYLKEVNQKIKDIKDRHSIKHSAEIKWTKASPSKIDFYLDLIDYFFDKSYLNFRGVVVNKAILDHKKYDQSHDEFYYKMYYELLNIIFEADKKYYVYIDIKDTRGNKRVKKLHEVLCNKMHDFQKIIIKDVKQVRSHEVNLLQITDLLIGALQFANRDDVDSDAKRLIVNKIQERSDFKLTKSTPLREEKFNIFHWTGSRC